MAESSTGSGTTGASTSSNTIAIQLTITAEDGSSRVPLQIDTDITATKLLEAAQQCTKIAPSSLKLIYRGRLIKAGDQLAIPEYKLESGSVIHCIGKPVKEVQVEPTTTATSSTSTVAATTTLPAVVTTRTSPPAAAIAAPLGSTNHRPPTNLTEALANIRSLNSPDMAKTAITTLDKLLNNIIQNPMEEKYRRIKKHNEAFGRRLGKLPGGHDAILNCGFVVKEIDGEEQYELVASEESWNQLLANKQIVETAVRTATLFPTATPAAAAAAPWLNPAATAGMANFFPPPGLMMGADGMPDMAALNSPEMQRMVQELLSNPAQVQAMLQNPMVQNMLRSDPRFANNPTAQQALSTLQNNPQAIAQMSQMFAALQQQQQQGMGGDATLPPPNPHAMAQMMAAMSGGVPVVNDSAQTEEEMIEEAIRRSLQDQNNNNNNDNSGNGGNNN